jgi:hypothetical protein
MSAMVDQPLMVPVCSYCTAPSDKLNYCSKCKIMRYCSKECQVSDWKNGHKALCKELCGSAADNDTDLPSTFLPAATSWARKTLFYYGLNKVVSQIRFQQILGPEDEEQRAIVGTDVDAAAAAACAGPMDAIPALVARLQPFLTLFYTHAKKSKQASKPHHTGGFLLLEAAGLSLQALLSPAGPTSKAKKGKKPKPKQTRDLMVHYFTRSKMVYYLKQFCLEKSLSLDDLLAYLKIQESAPAGQIPIITCFRGGYPLSAEAVAGGQTDVVDLNLGAIPSPAGEEETAAVFQRAASLYARAGEGIRGGESAQIDLLSGEVIIHDMNRKHFVNNVMSMPAEGAGPILESPPVDIKWFSPAYNEFVVRNLVYLSCFAEDKYKTHGKGILFIFSRNCRRDLFVDQRAHPEMRAADRQMLLVWVTEMHPDSDFTTITYIAKEVKYEAFTEEYLKSVASQCASDRIPFVLFTDPTGKALPPVFFKNLRPPVQNSENCLDVGSSFLPVIDRATLGTNAPPPMPEDINVLAINIDRD